MAIDAKLLVLDEPTLGLDILYRKQFYDSLLNDYFDRSRTIVVTTHQVEEIQHVITDVMFMDRGRIVFRAAWKTSRHAIWKWRCGPSRSARPGLSGRCTSGRQSVAASCFSIVSIAANSLRLATSRTPSIADLFIAVLGDKPGNQAGRPRSGPVNTMNTPPNAMPESSRDSQIDDSQVVRRRSSRRLDLSTGHCGANCGRTVRSISRRWPSPP